MVSSETAEPFLPVSHFALSALIFHFLQGADAVKAAEVSDAFVGNGYR